jgi:hypothetical protein
VQAKDQGDQEEKRRREEELQTMEKLNSNLNERIGSLLQEIRTLRNNMCELCPFFLSVFGSRLSAQCKS